MTNFIYDYGLIPNEKTLKGFSDGQLAKAWISKDYTIENGKAIHNGFVLALNFDCKEKRVHYNTLEQAQEACVSWVKNKFNF